MKTTMSSTLAAIVAFVAMCQGAWALPVTGTLGAAVSVTANTATTIAYTAGPTFVVTSSADADITLSAVASTSATLPRGYSALSFGASVGFKLEVSGSAMLTKAQLTTPPLTAAAAGRVTGSVVAGCLRFDASAEAYTALAIKSYTVATKAITVDIPLRGVYVFTAVEANVPMPTLYASARATSSTPSTFSYAGGFELAISTTLNNTVTVQMASTSSHADPSSKRNMGVFFDISLGSGTQADATLRYSYSASVAASAASSIRFAYWDTTTSAWVFPSSGFSVDTSARVVVQTTAHFSKWAPFSKNEDNGGSFGDDVVTPASPSRCFSYTTESKWGAIKFAASKKSSSGGNMRVYVKKGSTCPTTSSYQLKSDLATTQDEEVAVCVDSSTTPAAAASEWRMSVYAEGVATTTQSTTFSAGVERALFCSSASSTSLALGAIAVALLSVVSSALL